ncbi:MAG: ABC transporter ATP-binding protein [Candidatus Nanohaloarchaea archaeon]
MLKAENLSKSYGETRAVQDLSFQVEKGEIVGLIGPNGAGKSTTMEMCAGLLQPDSGRVKAESSLKQCVGIVFQSLEMRPKITVEEFLGLMKTLNSSGADIQEALRDVALDESDAWVEELSGGQKKKLNIASALVKQPDYLLLDESAAGLDVQSRTALEAVIEELGEEHGVLLSTHSMEIAERLCDRVVILRDGKKIVEGGMDELLDGIDAQYVVSGEGEVPQSYIENARVSGDYFEIFCDRPHEVLKHMVETGKIEGIDDIAVDRPGLEEVYLDATGERYEESS